MTSKGSPKKVAWRADGCSLGRGVGWAMACGQERSRQKEKHGCIFEGPNVKSFVPLGNKPGQSGQSKGECVK